MAPRTQLQSLLETLLGSENVYFNPPVTTQIAYPCIIYSRDLSNVQHADNEPFRRTKRYQVKLISEDPDDGTFEELAGLPMSTHSRSFKVGQLNHDVFDIFY